jgi:hypothetical protein
MTHEEIDERYRDAALDDDGDESWEEDSSLEEAGWDDPSELTDDPDDNDEDTGEES